MQPLPHIIDKLFTMHKLLSILCLAFIIACNNQASAPASEKTENKNSASSVVVTNLSTETEMEILAGCVENAKASNLEEAKAFTLCRCVLRQMQEKYPEADSTALVGHLRDTAQVVQMAKQCQ